MPAKTKTKTTKSNVAKSSGLANKSKFNWKIVAVIGVILVAAVGYLYVRLSHAAAFTWLPNSQGSYALNADIVTKSDGRLAWQAKNAGALGPYANGYNLVVAVNSSVPNDDQYCFVGKTTQAGGNWEIVDSIRSRVASGVFPNGDFRVCGVVKGTNQSRDIVFQSNNPAIFAVYTVERVGTTASAPGASPAAPQATPSAPPAAK